MAEHGKFKVECSWWHVQEPVFTPPADMLPWHTEFAARRVSFITENTFISQIREQKGDIMKLFIYLFIKSFFFAPLQYGKIKKKLLQEDAGRKSSGWCYFAHHHPCKE